MSFGLGTAVLSQLHESVRAEVVGLGKSEELPANNHVWSGLLCEFIERRFVIRHRGGCRRLIEARINFTTFVAGVAGPSASQRRPALSI